MQIDRIGSKPSGMSVLPISHPTSNLAFSIDNRVIGTHFPPVPSLRTEKQKEHLDSIQDKYSPYDEGNFVVSMSETMPLLLAEQQRGGVRSGTGLQRDFDIQGPAKTCCWSIAAIPYSYTPEDTSPASFGRFGSPRES